MKNLILLLFAFCQLHSLAQEKFAVYFDTDKFELTKPENQKLNYWMQLHSKDKIVAINGYTDNDGSNAYNDTLAKKRVNFIFDIIKEKVPFRDDFKSRSYGENFNQSKNKAENRKVTIFYIQEKDLKNENEILGIKNSKSETINEIEVKPDTISKKISLEERVLNTKIGSTVKIENINFHLNEKKLMDESFPNLNELLKVMQNQPDLVIEVQGHVCCNPDINDKISIKLSHQRAKVIRQFLVDNGIHKNRMSYKGYGSSQPAYKIPEKTYLEAIANRRVEILIVKK